METTERCAKRQKRYPSIKLKCKVYKTVIKSTMTHGAECWAVRNKPKVRRVHIACRPLAEMRTQRWTRKERVRNQVIREDAKVCQKSTFVRQKRLVWTHQEKNRSLSRKMVVPGWEAKKGAAYTKMDRQHPGRYDKIIMKWQRTWLKTDSTGNWLWGLTHKDDEMVCKCEEEKGETTFSYIE